jgi:pilus assembly protein CpaF
MNVYGDWEKVLPFFPDELQAVILDPTISYLVINGINGVYADRGGVVEHIPLREKYTIERLEHAIRHIARIMGQEFTRQNPILDMRMSDGSRIAVVCAPAAIEGPSLTIRLHRAEDNPASTL